jgi:V8-like Glu-specific endopeptidase
METTTSARTAHTSVSNISESSTGEAGHLLHAAIAPEEGSAGGTAQANANGTERISGYKPRHETASAAALAESFTVPDLSQLKDIGEASFGKLSTPGETDGAVVETVHGPDDRIQIKNTSDYPWRVHASLLITAADNSQWIGTGWFIGPHTLMTAGHVVFIKNSGVPGRDGWVKRIQVMPGRNGASLPYGSVTSTNFRSVLGWTNNGDENHDYGAIILSSNLGNTTGWLGFGVYADADLTAAVGNISGYPGDKASGTQWYDARRIASVNATKVYYDIDSFGGQSGSAVYRIVNGQRFGVAIHAYGGAVTNSGTRITTPVFNNMVAWKA